MDYALTFALLLYVNVFYFLVYGSLECLLLVFKATQLWGRQYDAAVILNEALAMLFLMAIESFRLVLGQRHKPTDFNSDLSSVFRLLVLTVPSMYAVAYFAFWQVYAARLETVLGAIMLVIQASQLICSFLVLVPHYIHGKPVPVRKYKC